VGGQNGPKKSVDENFGRNLRIMMDETKETLAPLLLGIDMFP
jgi:hypothetical protein